TNEALNIVAEATTVADLNTDKIESALYYLRVESDRLWPRPKLPLKGAGGLEARCLVDDLGLLVSLPLSTDTRGFAHLALQRLAEAGVLHAFDVLKSCLRWEWDPILVKETARLLTKHSEHCQRDDVVLFLLKSDIHELGPVLVDRLRDDKGVLLRHYAHRLTATNLSKLPDHKKRFELSER